MATRRSFLLVALAVAAALTLGGCAKHPGRPAPPDTNPLVFSDDFASAVDYGAFLGSQLDALSIDTAEKYAGTRSLKLSIPAAGGWAGGAFFTTRSRDLSGYDALTFYAKASKPCTLNTVGLGNNNKGTSRYQAIRADLPLTTAWTKVVIAVPNPARLNYEDGLFFFAEGAEGAGNYAIWFDEVRFERLGNVVTTSATIPTRTVTLGVRETLQVAGAQAVMTVGSEAQTVQAQQNYFTFSSSNEAVASTAGGVVRAASVGNATITATLGTRPATGTITLNTTPSPAVAAPAPPTRAASDVVSLYSHKYADKKVDKWSADWDVAEVAEVWVDNNRTRKFWNLGYVGIEFITQTIDVSAMTRFHMDVWQPDGTFLKIKLVDFGANGVYDAGPDDSEHELPYNAASTPPLVNGSWVSIDIPLSDFTGLTERAHLAQLIISANASILYVDNIYFHK